MDKVDYGAEGSGSGSGGTEQENKLWRVNGGSMEGQNKQGNHEWPLTIYGHRTMSLNICRKSV